MKPKAFTMVELVVVMIVISIMAAWGIPQYGRSLNRARARNAIQNLTIIHSANLLYRSRNNQNCTTASLCSTLALINNLNGPNSLNITAGGVAYTCADGGTTCTGTVSTATVTLDLDNPIAEGVNPVCADGGTHICP